MEKEKASSQGASKKKRAALAKRRKIRRIRKTVLTVLAALLPVALTVLIIILAGGKPEDPAGSTPADTPASGAESTAASDESAPETSRTEPSSEAPASVSESESAPASSEAPPETPAPSADIIPQETIWSGYYPAALPIAVQDGIPMPSWIKQDLLLLSDVNRPGRKLDAVRNIVIHYVGNTGSSAKDNRDYFQSQQDPREPSYNIQTSSHFIVDLDGTVLQCVPIDEVAYANYPRNYDTISVESCHVNDAGEYTAETYAGLVRLSAWLLQTHGLSAGDLLRHDDVRPVAKSCPKWFTDHPDAWETFKNDVRAYMDAHPDIGHEFP